MADYGVEIRTTGPSAAAVPLGEVTFEHHRAARARIRMDVMSGGHLLHLAVAACLFNDILGEARARGIAVTDLQVTADGAFGGDPVASTGITYAVVLVGDAPEPELRRLVADCEATATIPRALSQGVDVRGTTVDVRRT